jgi:hypothetical protein
VQPIREWDVDQVVEEEVPAEEVAERAEDRIGKRMPDRQWARDKMQVPDVI